MAGFSRILLTGVSGQVGSALMPRLLEVAGELLAVDHQQLDLADSDAIRCLLLDFKPTLIVNCAAYTAVDRAESEPGLAHAVNAEAPMVMAETASRLGALLVHFSTDYVFDGSKTTAYVESDAANPINVYGASKLGGEQAIQALASRYLILRTSWVYAPAGKNFLRTMLRLAGERPSLCIVGDQIGAPTSSCCIARATAGLLHNWRDDDCGLYHLTASGATSWHGFAQAILAGYEARQQARGWPRLQATPASIEAITTADYPTPARRPMNSRLDCSKLGKLLHAGLPDWQAALDEVMDSAQLVLA